MRVARSSPSMPLERAADAASVTEPQLRRSLRHLPRRGECARLAAGAASDTGLHWTARAAALQSSACPTATARLLAGAMDGLLDRAASSAGTAGWRSRTAGSASAPPAAVRGDVMDRLARNGREMPMLMLVGLADSPKDRTRRLVADRAGLPRPILALFAADPDPGVRGGVAHRVPSRLAAVLATDEDSDVRACAAANPDCSPDTLAVLARDDSLSVRAEAARHPGCPPQSLLTLTGDREQDVRLHVASNPNSPPGALSTLAANPLADTRISKTPVAQREQDRRSLRRKEILEAVAANPNCPPELAATFAASR